MSCVKKWEDTAWSLSSCFRVWTFDGTQMDDNSSLTVQTFCAYTVVCCRLENSCGSGSAIYIFASVNWLDAVFARFF